MRQALEQIAPRLDPAVEKYLRLAQHRKPAEGRKCTQHRHAQRKRKGCARRQTAAVAHFKKAGQQWFDRIGRKQKEQRLFQSSRQPQRIQHSSQRAEHRNGPADKQQRKAAGAQCPR